MSAQSIILTCPKPCSEVSKCLFGWLDLLDVAIVAGVCLFGLQEALGLLDVRMLELVELWWCETLAPEDLCLDPVWKDGPDLVVHVLRRRYTKNVVEFWAGVSNVDDAHSCVQDVCIPSSDFCFVSGNHRKIIMKARKFIAA